MNKLIMVSLWVFSSLSMAGAQSAEQDIINHITKLFVYTDEQKWDEVQSSFAKQVLLDYSSFTGIEAAEMTPDQLVAGWSGFLPGFEATHHQVGNFIVETDDDEAQLFCYGTATHYLPNESGKNVWTVVGTYDFGLVKTADGWKVNIMKFDFKYQDGNTDLPKLIQSKATKDK